jgi:hypothetical protein
MFFKIRCIGLTFRRSKFSALLDWFLHRTLFHRFDTLGSHLREEGSLDYDGGFVRLQVHLKFNTNIHRQQTTIGHTTRSSWWPRGTVSWLTTVGPRPYLFIHVTPRHPRALPRLVICISHQGPFHIHRLLSRLRRHRLKVSTRTCSDLLLSMVQEHLLMCVLTNTRSCYVLL